MSSDDQFYKFTQSSSSDIEESKSKGCSRERILWILLVLALIGALIGVSVHFTTKKDSVAHVAEGQYGCTQPNSTMSLPTKEPLLPQQLYKRINCIPESQGGVVQATEEMCKKRRCIFEETGVAGVPVCFFSDEVSYKVTSTMETDHGMRYNLEQKVKDKGPFREDMRMVVFDVEMKWDNIIRFKFDDSSFERFKVPLQVNLPSEPANNPKYIFRVTSNDSFAFQIIRNSSGQVLFDTSVGGLVLSNQFLQISTILPSKNIYGFGENLHLSYRHDLNYTTWPMFSRDQAPKDMPFSNLYGVHPFYMCLENDGNSHGVFLLNSNAMDYSFSPLPMLTYRTIGGILDFYMFLGPEPENVVQQYTGVIGRPYMPPYWALGFQLCRYGYKNLHDIQTAVNRTLKYGIPLEVQYADIDHMDRRQDFTLDKDNFNGLPDYFKELHDSGMRTVIILDPALAIETNSSYEPYTRLKELKGAVMWPNDYITRNSDADSSGAVLGYVWPDEKVVFPDFFKNKTGVLWVDLIVKHHKTLPFDALWIDMNEPANFGTNEDKPWNWPANVPPWSLQCASNNTFEDPPYRTKAAYLYDDPKTNKTARLSDKTLCMITRQGDNSQYMHYDVHNLYGWSETPATLTGVRKATGERSFVLSRSTYPGSGKYAGHWTGDNESVWPGLLHSIIGMLEFNLFGIPYVGADICGFWGNTTSEMCKRWMQLGAFFPFSRNHNQKDAMDQDPGVWEDVAIASREALETRYWLLPYLYTLFHKAHTDGNTVVRPLFHEFPRDNNTYGVDKQFMWGPGLMVIPILEQAQTVVTYYVPHGHWYDFYDGAMKQYAGAYNRTVDASSKIGLMVRGGQILPMQQPANTTKFSRKNPLELLVAMDEQGKANGELFWDDGISVDTYETGNYFFARFTAEKNSITMTIENDNTPELPHLYINQIRVYGAPPSVQRVYHDGKDVHFTYQATVLTLSNLTLTLTREFTIYWSTDLEDERLHVDCYPEEYGHVDLMTKESCEARNCIYNSSVSQGPTCYMNLVNYGYEVLGNRTDTENGFIYHLQKIKDSHNSPYHSAGSPDIEQLQFIVEKWGPNILRFRFEDVNITRYHVPSEIKIETNKIHNDNDMKYEVKVTNMKPFHFQVIRTTNQDVLWDTDLSSNHAISSDLTFSEQFLQITTKLPSKHIYGFGENVHHTFRHDLRHKKWPMWSRDQPAGGEHLNHYGVHPFYMCLEAVENGAHSHGVLLLNSNAQDYSFSPYPTLTYRTIGGVLDFYMFLGPTPENVVAQYTGTIGRPYMPPYWSLGFQLSRYGYNNISNIQDAVDKTRNAEIPHDIQYVDIDHMDERMDFTIDHVNFPGLNDYFKTLQSGGMHIIIILDPAIISNVSGYQPYIKMQESNSNIKWPSANIPPDSSNNRSDLLGYVWPKGKVVFPDFFKNSTKEVWKMLIEQHHNETLTFDGLWIDMNEPANFDTNQERPFNWPEDARPHWSLNCSLVKNTLEHPPYRTMAAYAHDSNGYKAMISDKTICMRAVQGEEGQYTHYNVHSLYGWSQTPATLEGLRKATGKRGIVISRSTFPGSGKYAGHWLGDNNSGWKDLQRSIIGSLEFNLFGIPYIGADICGFFSDTTPELCKRWMQLGAFYTFSRNHNGLNNVRQDPGSLGLDVAKASKFAMETRYWLLPYLYTLFHHAHIAGHTVMRPLHHEFPQDTMTYDIDKQFLWGPALMISPILYEGQTSVNIYVPKGPWYDYYTGLEVTTELGYINVAVGPDSNIPLHVRAGYILPMQAPANNTHFSRRKPFTLLVALKDSMNGGRGFTADGALFWDDGNSIDSYEKGEYYYSRFWSGSNILGMTVEYNNSTVSSLMVDTILVYGVQTEVKYVYVGNTSLTNITYDVSKKVLKIMELTLSLSQDFSLEWRQYRKPTAEEMLRVECAPDNTSDITQDTCSSRKCIYNATDIPSLPKCYINRTVFGYSMINNGSDIQLEKINTDATMFGQDVMNLSVSIIEHSNQVLQIKIFDPKVKRYEVPLKLTLPKENSTIEALYKVVKIVNSQNNEFSIQVIRKTTNKTIWDTSAGPLIFSNQYLQLSTQLPSDNLYGLGEHRHFHLKHSLDYKIWPIFTRDAAVNSPDFTNLYGAHPFYMNLEDEEGNAHAVLLLNSNAMEVVLEPLPRLTYRTIGGIFDFYIFMGPEPESVIKQYTGAVGKPVMVPYWALGFQLSRWGYNTLDNLKAAVNRTRAAGIPHDVQYADIDHMDKQRDFTYNNVTFAGLPEYVNELHEKKMHFIIILDHALSIDADYWPFTSGQNKDVFIKWPKNTGPSDSHLPGTDVMLGYVWPENKTVFPDFFKNETKAWWNDTICRWHNTIKFDGLWIDMNEPSNFDTNGEKPWNWPIDRKPYWSLKCNYDNNSFDHPPYKPKSILGDKLSDKTLCMVAQQGSNGEYKHYNVHSLYGMSQTEPTSVALQSATGKRGIVISRSSYPSSGRTGGHWLGDNDSFWRNLHDSIIGIIEFNLFGIPYIGADICGFFAKTIPEMCQRWMQLGAFYTFSRNHNGDGMPEQDPGIFGAHIINSSRIAMTIRYSLLPYLYTLFFHAHKDGGTVIRSMIHEFPKDKRTWNLDTQFLWGSAFLIAPVLEEGKTNKDVYLADARWFDYYTGAEMKDRKTMVTVDAPRHYIPLFLRGGFIIPYQGNGLTTAESRILPLGILVAPDDNQKAQGDLFWDDGESIATIEKNEYYYANFRLINSTVKMEIQTMNNTRAVTGLFIESIWIYGVITKPINVTDMTNHLQFHYYDTKLLHIKNLNLTLDSNFTVTWS